MIGVTIDRIIGNRMCERTKRILHAVLLERASVAEIAAREGVSRQRVYYLRARAMKLASKIVASADMSWDNGQMTDA